MKQRPNRYDFLASLSVFLRWLTLRAQEVEKKNKIDIYGFIMIDAGFNFNQIDPNWFDVVRPAKLMSAIATDELYHDFGQWLYTVGLPGKSGVGGGIIAVCPGKFGIAAISPPLSAAGNSAKALTSIYKKVKEVPLQQQWSYQNSAAYAPTYYLHSDARHYYCSFSNVFIAMQYRSPTTEQQERSDPMITGFNPADMHAYKHNERVLQTFQGLFRGIGEFGTDVISPPDEKLYGAVCEVYAPLWKALSKTANENIRIQNYTRLFDSARKKVRKWENANVKQQTQ
jgi:hypothetical protein